MVYYCVYWSPSNNTNDYTSKLMIIIDNENSYNECTFIIGHMNTNIIKSNVNFDYLDIWIIMI